MARNRHHYNMAAALVTYLRDGVPKQRHMNFILTTDDRIINMETLNQGRMAASQRLVEELNIEPGQMTDFVYISIFYLGHMTEREFMGQIPTPTVVPAFEH